MQTLKMYLLYSLYFPQRYLQNVCFDANLFRVLLNKYTEFSSAAFTHFLGKFLVLRTFIQEICDF